MIMYDFNGDGVVDKYDVANMFEKFSQGPYSFRDEAKWYQIRKHMNGLYRQKKLSRTDGNYIVDEMKAMSDIYYTEEEYKNDPGINPMHKNC